MTHCFSIWILILFIICYLGFGVYYLKIEENKIFKRKFDVQSTTYYV